MLNQPIEEIGANERQQGKFAELAAGFGGGVGAWRRIFDDQRPDAEIERDKIKWRSLHPKIVTFWHRLFKAVRIAVQMRTAVRVNEPPLPEIVCSFEDRNLYIILPFGRSLTYPGARLVPGKFENSVDLAYFDNSKKQWREIHEWYGIDRRKRGFGDRARSPGGSDRTLRSPRSAGGVSLARRRGLRGARRHDHRRRIPGDPARTASLGRRTAARR